MNNLLELSNKKSESFFSIKEDGTRIAHFEAVKFKIETENNVIRYYSISRSLNPKFIQHYISSVSIIDGCYKSRITQKIYDNDIDFNNAIKRLQKIIK